MTKTTVVNPSSVKKSWHLVDASSKNLGRVCTEIAHLLMGKGKPTFSYHQDQGDYVVVINAKDVQVTGRKLTKKMYYHYTGFPGGLRTFSLEELLRRDARRVIQRGVYGMLPKNSLRDRRMVRLKVFVDANHSHANRFQK